MDASMVTSTHHPPSTTHHPAPTTHHPSPITTLHHHHHHHYPSPPPPPSPTTQVGLAILKEPMSHEETIPLHAHTHACTCTCIQVGLAILKEQTSPPMSHDETGGGAPVQAGSDGAGSDKSSESSQGRGRPPCPPSYRPPRQVQSRSELVRMSLLKLAKRMLQSDPAQRPCAAGLLADLGNIQLCLP